MKNKLNIVFILIISILFASCDCPICFDGPDTESKCKVREVTITQFNPKLEKLNDTTLVPSAEYSIHSFLFPDDDNSTGSLPNDNRFEKSELIPLGRATYNDGTQDLEAILYSSYPQNENMIGDILIVSADSSCNTVTFRARGEIYRLPNNFVSTDAKKFCTEYMENNMNEIYNAIPLLDQYGKKQQYAKDESFSIWNFKVYDQNNNEVQTTPPVYLMNSLIDEATGKSTNLNVLIGYVFLYRAINGRLFVFAISDITKGKTAPYKNRVTLLFSPI